jgi:hypothetical protein
MSKDLFILGAGFSKAISSKMPTLIELSEIINPKLKDLFLEGDLPPKKITENVESLMSYLAEDHPWLSQSQQLRNRAAFFDLSKIIADEFGKKQKEINNENFPDWLGKLVESWHKNKTDVLSLNYDLLVEIQATKEIKDDDGHNVTQGSFYPVPLVIGENRRGPQRFSGDVTLHRGLSFNLYKLHGSINWFYSGSTEYFGEVIYTIPVTSGMYYEDNFHQNHMAGVEDKVPLVIPPTLNKTMFFSNETVKNLWYQAGSALREADRIFCLGYSFPLTDTMIKFFVLSNRPKRIDKFYWVNIDQPQEELKMILKDTFNVDCKYAVKENPIGAFVDDYVGGKIDAP